MAVDVLTFMDEKDEKDWKGDFRADGVLGKCFFFFFLPLKIFFSPTVRLTICSCKVAFLAFIAYIGS